MDQVQQFAFNVRIQLLTRSAVPVCTCICTYLTLACDTILSIASSSMLSAMMVGIVDAVASTSDDKRALRSASLVSDLTYHGGTRVIGQNKIAGVRSEVRFAK